MLVPYPHIPPAEPSFAGSAIHEFRTDADGAAHLMFVVLLLARLADPAPILWVAREADLYPPGLAWLGLAPARLIFAQARNDAECLGTLETALRGGMTGVAQANGLTRLAARRLALAAARGGATGFLLRRAPAFTAIDSTAPASRWLVQPALGQAGTPRLRAALLYAKGGQPPAVFFYDIQKEAGNDTPPALTLVAERPDIALRRTG